MEQHRATVVISKYPVANQLSNTQFGNIKAKMRYQTVDVDHELPMIE